MSEELKKEWYNGLLLGAILCAICIIIFSVFVGYPLWNKRDINNCVLVYDTSPKNTHVLHQHDCEEGCIYAEWILYGYQNLTKPVFYTECAEVCRIGDDYFKR